MKLFPFKWRRGPKKAKKPEKDKKAKRKQHDVKEKKEEKHKGKEKEKKEKKKRTKKLLHVKIIPKFYERWVQRQFELSGSEKDAGKFIKGIFIVSIIVGIVAGFLIRKYMFYVSPAFFVITFAFFNMILLLSVDRRGKFVNEILPDALMLLSANIRAGYIPSRALILSARTEFGPLSEAIKKAGKEIMSGKSLEEGMREIPATIKSEDLKRSINLIIEGIRGGGQIVSLLEENAVDIRRRQAIQKEIKANTLMYAIFIAFAGCLGAPGLYALSGYMTGVMSDLTPDATVTSVVSDKVAFFQMKGVSISEEFLLQFSLAAIIITTFFGGLILGLIGSGSEKDGLKFAPILSIIAVLVYLGASFLVSVMFGTMLAG